MFGKDRRNEPEALHQTRHGAGLVLEFWAARFPKRKPPHFVFPLEKYGGSGADNALVSRAVSYTPRIQRSLSVAGKKLGKQAKKRAGPYLERYRMFSKCLRKNGSSGRTRTYNPPVNSPVGCWNFKYLAVQMTTHGYPRNQAVTRRTVLCDPYLTHVLWRDKGHNATL